MKTVMRLIHTIKIGYAMYNFALENDGGEGPGFITREWNPREATTETLADLRKQMMATMHGLVRDNTDWAITFGVRLAWIKNLEEIQKYNPTSGQDIPTIIWTEEAKAETAALINGNHRYKLLMEDLAATMKQFRAVQKKIEEHTKRDKVTKTMQDNHKADVALLEQVTEVLRKEGRFAVLLVNCGE
jgi:hypothetical protein